MGCKLHLTRHFLKTVLWARPGAGDERVMVWLFTLPFLRQAVISTVWGRRHFNRRRLRWLLLALFSPHAARLHTALVMVAASAVLGRDGQSQPGPAPDAGGLAVRGGFAALHPRAWSRRAADPLPAQEHHILEQAKAQPAIPIKVLNQQWKEAEPNLPALSVRRAWQR